MAESLPGEVDNIGNADVHLADNRLNLDVFPNSTGRFSVLYKTRKAEVQQVEFLRLNCNEEQIDSSLAIVPELRRLKSLVLKGGHLKDEYGACQRGLLATLPVEFRHLQHLTHLDLSFNSFTSVPECVTELKELTVLLLSHNQLATLPGSIGKLAKLTFLSLMKNQLRVLPGSINELAALQRANISENELEQLPDEIGNLPNCAQLDLSGNRLTTIPSSLGCAKPKDIPVRYLASDTDSFIVTTEGCKVVLPCGIEIHFPPEALSLAVITCRVISPDPQQVKLTHHDFLLSQVLELLPHGIQFEKEVLIWMPYIPPQSDHQRELVIRTFSESWSDLDTKVFEEFGYRPSTQSNVLISTNSVSLNLDRSKLHLLHGDPEVQDWKDITNQVVLEFTHLYALFEVDHFSWYWLWYTTKTYVGGIAKKVYERLRRWQVNFLVLQRKKDPEQIFLQCVPKHKVETVCKKLETRYRGPEPSDIVEMFEGEQFFAGFEKGIKIDSDRPDCVDGRIGFTFYSHLKNSKEVYVSTEADRKTKAVKGQVSFYRGSLPENIPEEAAKKRKGPDSMWLATLPIKLPKQKSKFHDEPRMDPSYPPLNLGDEETGYLTEANLLSIARRIGPEWQNIGINLGLSYSQLERIGYNHRDDLDKQILEMLFTWAQCNESVPGCISQLIQAMKKSDREDIAEEIHCIIELGRRKYHDSIRRVGLSQESSNEDSAIAMV
ncbi:hypothetical protein chiPu_0007581 [Chiloscyllium punctatum]|uniref:Death domain-containing protein n=1 Tax=Chiloscyllium punctatum TaxID=137246 RepID=A0A401SFK5_CHIPU|nr:hypothetical protein [Chiloscyllium punctatum]